MSFASLGLSEALVRAIEAAGYTEPTPVQQRAIPAVLQGRDLMVAAQTGTGKTGGFALPILERLFPNGHPDKSQRHGQKTQLALTRPQNSPHDFAHTTLQSTFSYRNAPPLKRNPNPLVAPPYPSATRCAMLD